MSKAPPTLDDLRRYAVARTLFKPTTLVRAIQKLGFVQADPIRAPARAQDLTLRHRVAGYRAGDLERRYPRLAIEEDCLVNYGFLPRRYLALLHPRIARKEWDDTTREKADAMLAFIRERGPTHPRVVQTAFAHGRTTNYWGGSSLATTHLLDGMHYRGLLRVARRENGVRIYQAVAHPPAEDDAEARTQRAAELVELVIRKYAPLPRRSLGHLVYLLGYGAPHLRAEAAAVLARAREHLASTKIDGVAWYWPADENPRSSRWRPDDGVRFLAPFDPIVWDRRRFELLWGWTYRFEAYTPAAKRQRGYYALPLLFGDRVIGWANASTASGELEIDTGFAGKPMATRIFRSRFYEERQRMAEFLGL